MESCGREPMKNETDELLRMKDKIDSQKTEKARVEGELRQLQSTMKEEWGTDNPQEIQVKMGGLKRQAANLRVQINEGMTTLRRELGE